MYETQRNAGRLFLHEHPWDAWSRGLSFVNEMAEKDGVHKTKGDLSRFQLATNSVEKRSWFMSFSERIIEELSKRCCNKGGQAKNHMKNSVVAALKGLKREIDSVKAIGSMEVGVTCEEPNALELDEDGEELHNVFDNISGVRLDPELLSTSRKVEIDFMNRLEVYRRRPRELGEGQGHSCHPNEMGGRCGKELKRWDPTMPVMWKPGATTRKILFLDASRALVKLKRPVRWRLSCLLKNR